METVKRILLGIILSSMLGCAEEDVRQEDDAAPFYLDYIAIDNSAAFFTVVEGSYYNNETRYNIEVLYKLDKNMNTSAATLVFSGDPVEDARYYNVFDIDEKYFLVSFFVLQQNYFIDKTNGKAIRSAYFLPNYHFRRFGVDGNQNFFFRDDLGGIQKVSNYLSDQATVDALPVEGAERFFIDKDDNLVYVTNNSLHAYSNGSTKQLSDERIGVWKGLDGVVRTVKSTGEIGAIVNGEIIPDQSLPFPISFIHGVYNFPGQNTTVGVELNKGENFSIYELDPARDLRVQINENSSSFEIIDYAEDRVDQYLYILFGVRDETKTLAKIDITDYTVSTNTINTTHPVHHVYALDSDITLVGVCVPQPTGGCRVQFGYLTPTGDIHFLLGENQWFGEMVKM